jgi:glycosyltransferase involved in cell wall biosynthesis
LRLAVVSPFLDRQHGTELCITEQIERFVSKKNWNVELYSQKVSQVNEIRSVMELSSSDVVGSIIWHPVSDIPGPHLLKYLWWFCANRLQRWRDGLSGKVRPDLVYSPGINCFDADVIVVHIVFHAFYESVRAELKLSYASPGNWPRLIHRRLYYSLIMALERRVYTDTHTRLIAVSGLVASQLKSHFKRIDVTVIPNAVDSSRFNAEARALKREGSRKSFGYDEDKFVLLLIGNDWKKKGLETLLRAAKSLENAKLRMLIVGSDDPALFLSLIDQLNLRDQVRFEKPTSDVLSFYAAADAYLGPSLEDAFNLPILESMACGLPVIASIKAGASELISDGKNGLILRDPADAAELAILIEQITKNSVFRQELGAAAALDVRSECNWDQNAARTAEVLEATLKSKCDRAL